MAGSVKLLTPSGGSVTINATDTASALSLTLPATNDNIITANTTQTLTNKTLTNPVINGFTGDTSAITIGTTQFVKDTSGNIGIGTSSPTSGIQLGSPTINASGTSNTLRIYRGGVAGQYAEINDTGAEFILNSVNVGGGGFGFFNDGARKVTIDSSGNLLVGDTSSPTAAKVMSKNTVGQFCYVSNAANQSGGYYHIAFLQAGTLVGSITSSGSTTTYNTTSDQRLKTDLGPATETSVIDNTVIHDFEWKSDGIKCRGVFAQEAVVVNPNAVNQGISDELNEEGLPVHPWGVDYSKYVPDLIVYCQQLKAQNNALEARLAQLEAK